MNKPSKDKLQTLSDTCGRQGKLKDDFNDFWNKSLKTSDENYYSKLTGDDFIKLKSAISCVNNIITLKTTIAFIDYLLDNGHIKTDNALEMKAHVLETNANANGFDIEYQGEVLKIVAEVKCNKPVNKHSFGPAQVDGILNDLKRLVEGKTKSHANVNDCLKFMVLLRLEAVEESMKKVINTFNEKSPVKAREIDNKGGNLTKGNIYVVYIDTNKI